MITVRFARIKCYLLITRSNNYSSALCCTVTALTVLFITTRNISYSILETVTTCCVWARIIGAIVRRRHVVIRRSDWGSWLYISECTFSVCMRYKTIRLFFCLKQERIVCWNRNGFRLSVCSFQLPRPCLFRPRNSVIRAICLTNAVMLRLHMGSLFRSPQCGINRRLWRRNENSITNIILTYLFIGLCNPIVLPPIEKLRSFITRWRYNELLLKLYIIVLHSSLG